jgi:alpha,alpha-trehalase
MPATYPDKPQGLARPRSEPRLALDVRRLGLDAILFDLDGVVTQTASLHARVWRRLFNDFLARKALDRADMAFHLPEDYHAHVDGKPRIEGVQSFLQSRGIELPFGSPSDDPGSDTVWGLGNEKTHLFQEVLDQDGVEVFDGTVAFLRAVRESSLRTACVSSSFTCRTVLDRTRLTAEFDIIYDGHDLEREGRPGKPAPDGFLRAAALVGVEPAKAAVVEDAVVGVAAGRAGGFRLVIGIDRGAGRDALLDAGADIVVSDLAELMIT